MNRLAAARLGEVHGAETPGYERAAPPSIVHLGVGAFARAHLCVYADDLLRLGHHAAVHGVSLRSDRAREELAPQDGLFTLVTREPGTEQRPRIVGSLTRVETGAAAAVAAIARPTTRLVTMTVTEKGYEVLTTDDDLLASAVGTLVAGLDRRRRDDEPAPVVASMDNLADNGTVLHDAAVALAGRHDAALARWIDDEVRFPRSVVDRMVPATSEADRDEVAERLGMVDRAVVVAERHRSWAIDRVDGLLPLDEVGVDVVDDIGPAQMRKLWLLNGPHSAFAYAGLLAGCVTIAEAATHPVVAPFVDAMVSDVLEVAPGGAATIVFAEESLRRFSNPALGHRCAQVGADGSRKLPQRLLPVVARRRAESRPTQRLALVVAAWLTQIAQLDDPVRAHVLDAATDEDRVAIALKSSDRGFRAEVTAMMRRVRELGPEALEDVG